MSELPEELHQKVMDAIPAEQQRVIERQYAELVHLRDTLVVVRERIYSLEGTVQGEPVEGRVLRDILAMVEGCLLDPPEKHLQAQNDNV